ASPKEAARRVRELLGTDTSVGGLNQLLWLDQGEVNLPKPKDLDSSLQQRLLHVLGVLVTGRDQKFMEALAKRCDRWFTPETKKYQKNSEVERLAEERTKRKQA